MVAIAVPAQYSMPLSRSNQSRSASVDQLALYHEVFSLFDKDNSGTISSTELAIVMRSFGLTASDAQITYIMEEIDSDKNGMIDFDEFVRVMASRNTTFDEEAELREAFQVFDKDGSGNISIEELSSVMKSLGEKLTNEELAQMIMEADLNGDNEINFDEFKNIIKAT